MTVLHCKVKLVRTMETGWMRRVTIVEIMRMNVGV
jgi:hypothetical protein